MFMMSRHDYDNKFFFCMGPTSTIGALQWVRALYMWYTGKYKLTTRFAIRLKRENQSNVKIDIQLMRKITKLFPQFMYEVRIRR